MYKSLAGIAGAAMLFMIPAPADAFAVRHLSGAAVADQANVEDAQYYRRRVYRRAGRPFSRCGTIVRSRGQGDANRTAYWCPGCQA